MIGRQAGEGALDLAAVQRDDDLLALLAERGEVDASDPVTRLLVALADDVDDGLAELLVATDPPTTAGATWVAADVFPELASDPTPRSRRTAAGAAAVAVALAATLSVSGVAAAVTGDPLAPYKAVGSALSWGEDDLPETAAPIAHLNKRLARARAAIAHGEVEGAQARLDALRALLAGTDLSDGQRAAFERKLDRLEAALESAGTRGRSGEKGGPPADKPPAADPPGQVGKDKAGKDKAEKGTAGQDSGEKGKAGQDSGGKDKAPGDDDPGDGKGGSEGADRSGGTTSAPGGTVKKTSGQERPGSAKPSSATPARSGGPGRARG